MSYLVRKITRAKWSLPTDGGPINADAITQCLKTKDNTLSFWYVSSEQDIADGVLAIVASNDNLDKLDVVVLSEEVLLSNNISIESTPGKTACADLVGAHRDLAKLNIKHLAVVSEEIAEKIKGGKTVRYTLSKLRALLLAAVADGRINVDSLSEGVRRKILPPDENDLVVKKSCPTCGIG